jgi:hypothetical protein
VREGGGRRGPEAGGRAALGSRGRGEEKGGELRRKRKKGKRGKKERREKRNGREKKEKKKERAREKRRGGGVASAPIAAVTAVGRPYACVIRALREKRIAPALIAEKRSRVVVGRRAVRDGTTVKSGVGQRGLGLGF